MNYGYLVREWRYCFLSGFYEIILMVRTATCTHSSLFYPGRRHVNGCGQLSPVSITRQHGQSTRVVETGLYFNLDPNKL